VFGFSVHRLIIYFPILLVWGTLLLDLWAVSSGNRRLHNSASSLSKWSLVAALVAVATGFSLAGMAGLGSGGGVTGHAGAAGITTIVVAVLAFIRYAAENRADLPEEAFRNSWLVVEMIAAILVTMTAGLGFGL